MNERSRIHELSTEPKECLPQLSRLQQMQVALIKDLQLAGKTERTQESYLRAIRKLSEVTGKPPDQVEEEDLRNFFLHVKNDLKWSRVTSTIALCGIKFFFDHTIHREWPTLRFVRATPEKKLPVILSHPEVVLVLGQVKIPLYRVCLQTIYACGLRLQEGTHLQVRDIDSGRMMIHIHHGKGGRERYVPLPESTLLSLREIWKTHGNPVWIFPACGRGGIHRSKADRPVPLCNIQDALRAALKECGINKGASVHTLRHSWATHMLEAGVNLRQIQEYLGHTSPKTTAIYTHLTEVSQEHARSVVNSLTEGL